MIAKGTRYMASIIIFAENSSDRKETPAGTRSACAQPRRISPTNNPNAPLWMQRWGLTWAFRLWSEPFRLAPRYLKYNSLFLFYLLRDALSGRAWEKAANGPHRLD